MHIVLIVDDYLPSEKSAAIMMHQLAESIVSAGHQVTLLTPSAVIAGQTEITVNAGFSVIRFRSGRLKNVNKVLRCINESLLSWRLMRAAKAYDLGEVDLIAWYSPSIFWGIGVGLLKRRLKCKAFLILRDIFPQWAIDNGILSARSPIYAYFKCCEAISYRMADRIGVQSQDNMAYFDRYPQLASRLTVFPNWCQPETLVPALRASQWREKLGLTGKVIFFFGGNMGKAQDMGNIVRLAVYMKRYADVHFLLVGKGDEFSYIEKQQQALALTNITLLPAVSQMEYFEMLAGVDVGMFSLYHEHKTQNVPGKLLGYMALKKPILGSIDPGNSLRPLINETGAGLVSVNPDDKTFAKNAERMLDPEARKQYGENAFRLLESHFSCQSAVEALLKLV